MDSTSQIQSRILPLQNSFGNLRLACASANLNGMNAQARSDVSLRPASKPSREIAPTLPRRSRRAAAPASKTKLISLSRPAPEARKSAPSTKKSASKAAPHRAAKAGSVPVLGVVAQLRLACQPKNRVALVAGAIGGGVLPALSAYMYHFEVNHDFAANPLYAQVKAYFVLGALLVSAISVFDWTSRAFHKDYVKAGGFVLFTEGSMLTSGNPYVVGALLCLLVTINAIVAGANLALEDRLGRSRGARS